MAVFSINTKIYFGHDAMEGVYKCLQDKGMEKVLFIVDKQIRNLEVLADLVSLYEHKRFNVLDIVAYDACCEPTYDDLDEFTQRVRRYDMDAIIGVGGGSVLDIAKGCGILLKNPGRAIEYRGIDKVKVPGVPVVCYPSTAGTGTEVTHTASFIDTRTKTKLGINGRYVSPLCGVLMPELTFSCPLSVTVSSGLDAMVHAIEAVSARNSNTITTMLGAKAFALLYNNLEKVLESPEDYNARESMLMGSYYAGAAMMNAGGGPSSGISYPLGVHYGVAHGIAGGICLMHVFRYNVSKGYYGYAVVYDELYNNIDKPMDDKGKSERFVDIFDMFYERIAAPRKLCDMKYTKVDAKMLTELTITQRKANLELNPVVLTDNDVLELILKIV